MAFLEKKLLSKKDLFILFGKAAGTTFIVIFLY
jgi:hypothetical protein